MGGMSRARGVVSAWRMGRAVMGMDRSYAAQGGTFHKSAVDVRKVGEDGLRSCLVQGTSCHPGQLLQLKGNIGNWWLGDSEASRGSMGVRFSCTAADVSRLCDEGRVKEAVSTLENMDHEGIWSLSTKTYSRLLLECMKKQALSEGKRVHAHIRKAGLHSNFYLGILLVRMYCACGKMGLARNAFDRVRSFADYKRFQNVFIWNVLIRGYVRLGHTTEALSAFQEMIHQGVQPDKFVLVTALAACTSVANLEDGRRIHDEVIKSGLAADQSVNNALVEMYGKCGSTKSARMVFENMKSHNVVSWNALIAGYSLHGHGDQALKMFQRMLEKGLKPDRTTFASTLKACADMSALEQGKQVHSLVLTSEFVSDSFLGAALIDMFVKCGSMQDACRVFEKLPRRTASSWTAIIRGLGEHGLHREVIKFFKQMLVEDQKPTSGIYIWALNACAELTALQEGEDIHALISRNGGERDVLLANALIDMYAKCGVMEDAKQIFYKMPHKDIDSWNLVIEGCKRIGQSTEALKLYKHLLLEKQRPNIVTYISTLDVCANLGAPEEGKRVYAHALKDGLEAEVQLDMASADMLARCDCIQDSIQVLHRLQKPNDMSWEAFIAENAKHRISNRTLDLLEKVVTERRKAE